LLLLGCVIAALELFGCQQDLNVGEWMCASNDADAAPADTSNPIAVPWSTGFEAQFCDYTALAGFCYAEPLASYTIVTSPVHSGRSAAAFRVEAGNSRGHQTRCVRQGSLPTAAYYGAWYFVPELVTNSDLWNLIHFEGNDGSGPHHGLWDISLVNGTGGALEVVVYDFLNGRVRRPATPKPIPIGSWFHLELYLKRAADATGEVALYQDGQQLVRAENIVTDDSSWGQWYVGNLASALTPSDSTLYVDDVTIRATR
jgi:hypothetical protein